MPVAARDVPESGRRFQLAAEEGVRSALATAIGLRTLPRLEARFEVTRQGREGLRVAGQVSATVGQTCVVTLEPIDRELEEPVDIAFRPQGEAVVPEERGGKFTTEDAPEPLVGGVVDLGAIAVEHLILGIDPYPRKSDAVFDAPAVDDDSPHPFAALAALKKGQGGQ